MKISRIVMLTAAVLVLAACQQESAPPASAQAGSGTSTQQTVVAKSDPSISVDPGTMKSCDSVVATVHWDASKAGANTSSTEIWVGPTDTDAKLFSAGGKAGETETGPWTQPGTHFVLKDKQDGKVLGEAVVGGPSCR
ncbi:MAG TPA: hypothetical protein VGU65_12220 [Frateuria sp.]|uniref:hypothetical protein n=1 Tax=Frateuria sp. TaxID=2211372 RepID=UPI002DE5C229|nr:hypothetical protein [Frateuria sp.]